jgi:hypothetical protein
MRHGCLEAWRPYFRWKYTDASHVKDRVLHPVFRLFNDGGVKFIANRYTLMFLARGILLGNNTV